MHCPMWIGGAARRKADVAFTREHTQEFLPDLAPDLTRRMVDCVHIHVCAAVDQSFD